MLKEIMMNPATKALSEIKEANTLPNRTKKALGPESKEDFDAEQKGDEQ